MICLNRCGWWEGRERRGGGSEGARVDGAGVYPRVGVLEVLAHLLEETPNLVGHIYPLEIGWRGRVRGMVTQPLQLRLEDIKHPEDKLNAGPVKGGTAVGLHLSVGFRAGCTIQVDDCLQDVEGLRGGLEGRGVDGSNGTQDLLAPRCVETFTA